MGIPGLNDPCVIFDFAETFQKHFNNDTDFRESCLDENGRPKVFPLSDGKLMAFFSKPPQL